MAEPAKKDTEIYVNFSSPEEPDIIEEVVSSDAQTGTAESPLEKLQAQLPPSVAEAIERLKESYAKNSKYYLIGIVVLIVIFIVGVVGVYLYFTSDQSSSGQGWNSDGIFTVGPVRIEAGQDLSFNFTNIPRPTGALSVFKVDIAVLDSIKNTTVPLFVVYNHHIYILNQNYYFVAGSGAEASFSNALDLPNNYCVPVAESDTWNLFGEFINVWGEASHAPMDVYIQYHVYYSSPNPDTDVNVAWTVVGETQEYDVPGTGTPAIWNYDQSFSWDKGDATIVVAQPHAHIGALNITLWDATDAANPKLIATAVPDYANGYIVGIDATSPFAAVNDGTVLRITASYDNTKPFGNVMNLFQIWGTFAPDNSLFIGDAPPSASPSPSPAPAPSTDVPSPSTDVPSPSPEPAPSASATPAAQPSTDPSPSPSTSQSRSPSHTRTPPRSTTNSRSVTVTPTVTVAQSY